MHQFVKAIILATAFACSACSVSAPVEVVIPAESVIQCGDSRPQMCTREYNPVCATKLTGVQCVTTPCPSTEELTYATGCTACADTKVIHYRQGSCDDTGQ